MSEQAKYFDTNRLNESQRALFTALYDDAYQRVPELRGMLDKAHGQHGVVHLAMYNKPLTGIYYGPDNTVLLNINLDHLERAYYLSRDAQTGETSQHAASLQNVLVHEVAHLARDKKEAEDLLRGSNAGGLQQVFKQFGEQAVVLQLMSSGQLQPLMKLFDVTSASALVDAIKATTPIDPKTAVEAAEIFAIDVANHPMLEHYGEPHRITDNYAESSKMLDRRMICAVDDWNSSRFEAPDAAFAPLPEDMEPCAYAHIAGRQPSVHER